MFTCLSPGTVGGGLSYEEFVALAKRHGFAAVEFGIEWLEQKIAAEGEESARQWLAEQTIQHAVFGLPVAWGSSESEYAESLKSLPAKAKVAQAVGCNSCTTYIPPSIAGDPKEFWAMMVRRFREICSILADYDVKFGIEWIGPLHLRQSGNPVMWRMDQALQLCEEIGAANIGLLVDSFHWFCSQHTVDELAALPKERIVHVHINDAPDRPVDEQIDNERLMPGDGIIDLFGFLKALKSAGYDGAISVEVLSKTLPQQFSKDELAMRAKMGLDKILAQV
ncbi:MAG: sugar phosphate isomerase/epimerase [Armatimonadetes bacterium]|nr:sugar phosphate isomerase/epimerase [Armatimonadota bacterium]